MNDAFERIVANLDSPMFVVTAFDGDERDGCLVGFATQCSIEPARFLVCLSVKNRTTRIARRASVLAVHALRDDQRDLAEQFGGRTADETGVDKFASVAWHDGPHGVPVLDGCDWFAGHVIARYDDVGDHEAFVLDVASAGDPARRDEQLGYQDVRDVEAGHPPRERG
jgi:flavin reductase (DIM6/NTAB) family NADH-FMN oxidoreductase RutF